MFTRAEHKARQATATPPAPAPATATATATAAAAAAASVRGSIAFVSTMCLLDPVSGAALSVRALLQALAAAGFEARAYGASLFDQNTEVGFGPILGKEAAAPANRGKILRLRVEGVEHSVLLTASSRGPNMTAEEQGRLIANFRSFLAESRPDIVLSYGTSEVARRLQAEARAAGASVVFYLGNAETDAASLVQPGDGIVSPSDFLAAHYRAQTGIAPAMLRPIIRESRFVAEGEPAIAAEPALRRLGLITFVNPIPHKGLTLLTRIAQRAAAERPEMTFAVVEGRMTRELAAKLGVDLAGFPNVWWMAPQKDLRALLARTAVLLIPSFWREGFGRSVVEAQLSGVPVIASRQGGLGEALNGGGIALDIPEACAANPYSFPDADTVDRWWAALLGLWDDEAAYRAVAARARVAAAPYAPEATRAAVLGHFEAVLAARRAGAAAG